MNILMRSTVVIGAALVASAGCVPAEDLRAPVSEEYQQRQVLVAGATGRLGRHIVEELQREGFSVRALVRDRERGREVLGPGVELFEGDVKNPESLVEAVTGTDALISAIGANRPDGPDRPETIDYQGVKNLVDVAVAAGVGHFVLVSSRAVTYPEHPLNANFGNVLLWKLKGEDYLRASGIAYSVARPGGLTDDPPRKHAIYFEQGDSREYESVSRGDVAMVLVEVLRNPHARDRTFEISRATGAPPADWSPLFAALDQD